MDKLVIGLTGSISSGKSTVANIIRNLGYEVIDCDQIGHNLLEKDSLAYKSVLSEFGNNILDENDNIKRKVLSQLIFNDNIKREKLNAILHPLIKKETAKKIKESKNHLVFMECPLLFETDFISLCDYSIVVYVDMDNQIWRLMKRDGIDFPNALKKIYAQMPLQEKMEKADFIIDNCHNEGDLKWQVEQIISTLERKK